MAALFFFGMATKSPSKPDGEISGRRGSNPDLTSAMIAERTPSCTIIELLVRSSAPLAAIQNVALALELLMTSDLSRMRR